MPASTSILTDPATEVILAYAATGLGHLRVTNALFESAPHGVYPHLLRTQDQTASSFHRLTSIYPRSRAFLEWSQQGRPEEFFTRAYTQFLRQTHKGIESELATLIEQEFNIVKRVVVVATHFGLAHQIAGAKKTLERRLDAKIMLAVVVTDDSPQKVWLVPQADVIFTPSQETKIGLLRYAHERNVVPPRMEVIDYPLSRDLTKPLKRSVYLLRREQHDPMSSARIEIAIPISGAAVNLDYLENLMSSLYKRNRRFFFYVVSKDTLFTRPFLNKLARRPYVSLITSHHDREIVKYYNQLLKNTSIAFEVTKPSEQSFKALISPKKSGGVTLLFSEAVGRQEHDNLSYLERNGLLNSRYFVLPKGARQSAEYIVKALNERIFLHAFMNSRNVESRDNGATEFWDKLAAEKFL